MAAFSKLPVEPFKQIAFNAGVITSEFDVKTGELDRTKILFATTGGSQFNPNLTLADLFEDIDNAKPGTKQGMLIQNCEPHLTTTVLTVGDNNIEKLVANATKETVTGSEGVTHITPKDGIINADSFFDLWVITDYATMTGREGNETPGFFAIHLKNCINVTGFQQQTTADGKVQYSVDFRAFYDTEADEEVPYEIYFSSGQAAAA